MLFKKGLCCWLLTRIFFQLHDGVSGLGEAELQCASLKALFLAKSYKTTKPINIHQLSSTPLLLLISKPNIEAKLVACSSCLPWWTSTARAWWTNWISAWRFWAAGVSRRIDLADYMMLVDDDWVFVLSRQLVMINCVYSLSMITTYYKSTMTLIEYSIRNQV